MKPTINTEEYIVCPNCNYNRAFSISQFKNISKQLLHEYTWVCDICGQHVKISFDENSEMEIEKVGKDVLTYVLLKFDSTEPLYAIITANHNTNVDEIKYIYEEHSCPTNWLRDITTLIHDVDTDPHGIFKVMSILQMEDEYSIDFDGMDSEEIFEAFGVD